MFAKMKKMILSFFLFVPLLLRAEEELTVELSTQSALAFLYRSPIYGVEAKLENRYIQELQTILHRDLEQAGIFLCVSATQEKDALLNKSNVQESFDPKIWRKENIAYVAKALLKQQTLELQFFHVHKAYLEYFQAEMTGRLNEDRKKIHQLCDYIVEKLTGKKGIASGRILYTVRQKNTSNQGPEWISEVWISDSDGSNVRMLTHDHHYSLHPLFISSRFPNDFIYTSYKTGQPKIYRFWADKGESTPLVSLKGNQILPALSRSREVLAFICDAAGRPDLFLQKLDAAGHALGKPLQLFSFPRATQASPTFSPDGRKIAFVSDKDGTPRIYVIQIPQDISFHKRPEATMITKKNRENVSPSWSSDGTKLAYSAKTEGIRQIWIYDFRTNEEWQLTKGSGNKENPCWGSDSLHIVYNTEDQNSGELFMIDLNRQIPVKISSGAGKKRFPCWEPF